MVWKWREGMPRSLGENTEGNTEGSGSKKSELWTPRRPVLGDVSLLYQVPSRVIALGKRDSLRIRGKQASDRADDSIARFGTLSLRVLALTESANASEKAWNRRKTVRKNDPLSSSQGLALFRSACRHIDICLYGRWRPASTLVSTIDEHDGQDLTAQLGSPQPMCCSKSSCSRYRSLQPCAIRP
jgi:hypothetical protein